MPTIKELEQWLSTGQAASRLNKSRQGIVWMVENRKLRASRTPLGWLIDPKSVEAAKTSRGEET
jgi:excisionase family DNA binding protein